MVVSELARNNNHLESTVHEERLSLVNDLLNTKLADPNKLTDYYYYSTCTTETSSRAVPTQLYLARAPNAHGGLPPISHYVPPPQPFKHDRPITPTVGVARFHRWIVNDRPNAPSSHARSGLTTTYQGPTPCFWQANCDLTDLQNARV